MGDKRNSEKRAGNLFPADTFPGMIREGRLAAQLGVNELARRAGCSWSAIVKFEFGRTVPRPELLKRLAEQLGKSPGEFAKAAKQFKDAKKSGAIIPGRPPDLESNLEDLPLAAELLAVASSVSRSHGRTTQESIDLIRHLAAFNGGFDSLLEKLNRARPYLSITPDHSPERPGE